jgi:hypothetical protein
MGDLDELASALRAREHRNPSTSAPPPVQHANVAPATNRDRKKPVLVYFLAGLSLFLFAALVAAFWLYDRGTMILIRIPASPPVLANLGQPQSSPNPKFTAMPVSFGSDGTNTGNGWQITNTDSSPLTIYDVTLNGEYAAPLAVTSGSLVIQADQTRTLPVTISIGDSAYFLKNTLKDGDPDYWQEVIFVEVNTNRGKLKFDGTGMPSLPRSTAAPN